MSELILGVILGGIIGIAGQIVGNRINHKNKITYLKIRWVYEEKIKNYKKILDFLDSQNKIVEGLMSREIDPSEFEDFLWNDLVRFYQLNPDYHFFNSKEIKALFYKYTEKIKFIPKEFDEDKTYEELIHLRREIKKQIERELVI